jgi:hypothetical protein
VGWKADVRHAKQIGTGQDVLAPDSVGTSSPFSFPRLSLTIRAHQLNDDGVRRHVKEQKGKEQRVKEQSVYHSCIHNIRTQASDDGV